jgi:hypothetical protein
MKITRISILLTLFIQLMFINIYAADGFKNGEQVNVWAVDGLALRQEVGKSGKLITTIPYGQRVTVLSSDEVKLPANIKMHKWEGSITLKGRWIKVLYKGKQGFVFDGYLSKMPPFFKGKHTAFETEEEYFKRNYGVLSEKKIAGKEGFEKTTASYKNGAVKIVTFFDGCFDTEIYLKSITYQEGFLFEEVLLKDADAVNDLKINKIKNGVVKISYYSCD